MNIKDWTKPFSLVLIVAIVAVTAYLLAVENKSFTMRLNKDGDATITVYADDNFGKVLDKAIAAEAKSGTVGEIDAILASRSYYKLTNPGLTDALARLSPSQPGDDAVAKRLRAMLWDLRGPFELPNTLRGADERMIKALDDLDAPSSQVATDKLAQASGLLAAMWNLSLDRKGIFRPRFFRAKVEVVHRAPASDEDHIVVLACPGSALVSGRVMSLYTDQNSIMAEVTQDPSLFDCGGSALTAAQLLAGGKARLGLSEKAFKDLMDPAGASRTHSTTGEAKFELFPRDLVGRLDWSNGA